MSESGCRVLPRRALLARIGALAGLPVLAGLTGCGGAPAPGSPADPDADSLLRLAQTAEPTTLDPAQVQDGPTIELLMHVFDGLIQWTTENRLAPALAESWDISDGGRTYTFRLREGASFHNGRAVTAEDFVYSLTRSLDPAIASPVALVYLNDIVGAAAYHERKADRVEGIEAPDSRTLRLRIDRPKAYFLAKLTYPTAYAVCREALEAAGGTMTSEAMIGTGPFRLTGYQRGDRLILEAYRGYFEGAPRLQRIERRILLDNNTRYDKFAAGELDIVGLTMAQYRAAREDNRLQPLLRQFPRPSVYYLALNRKAYAPFGDRRVRRAIALAVDKSEIVRTIHEGVPRQANGIIPPGVPGHDESYAGLAHSASGAGALLREAGYPGGQGLPPLTLNFRASEDDLRNTAVAVAGQLQRHLGLQVRLEEVEWGDFLGRRNRGEMGFYFLRWAADYLDPQNFLSTMLHSRAPENTLGYANPEFDRLCETADVMQEPGARLATYRLAERIAVEDAPWVPIYFQQDVELWNPRLAGVEDCAMGHLPHKRTHFTAAARQQPVAGRIPATRTATARHVRSPHLRC